MRLNLRRQSDITDMLMRPLGTLTALCCIVSCLSCSVKEDRSSCPCRLILDMSDVDTSIVKSAEIVVSSPDGFLFTGTHSFTGDGDECILDVPRGEISVGVFYGASELINNDCSLIIPYGDECPQVYMHSSVIMADGELERECVHMCKNFCIMTLRVLTEEEFPFRLETRGSVDGYVRGGAPSDGDFAYTSLLDGESECVVSLPRQVDNSLKLEVNDGTEVLKTFALGEYLEACGYDWSEDDLKDIIVTLDYSLTRIHLKVEEWKEEYVFDVVI